MSPQQRKRYIIVASIAVIALVALVIFLSFFNNQTDNSSPNQNQDTTTGQTEQPGPTTIAITNFNNVVIGLPTDRRRLIEENLFITVEMNLPNDDDPAAITDASIRNGSYSRSFDDQTQILSTEFIVDIPSIKQSYRVTDIFSALPPEVTGLFDHTTNVFCLDASQLIYPPFDCKDNTNIGDTPQ